MSAPDIEAAVAALLPPRIAEACERAGIQKASRDLTSLLVLGVLAGAFIAFGAVFMTVVMAGSADVPFGLARLAGGVVFSLGLILVIVGGAELFTGDALMVVAWANRRISSAALLRAWGIVYIGNIIGAAGTAVIVFLAGHYMLGGGEVGRTALAIATAKASISVSQLFFLSILCNVLVCLAVWMAFAARNTVDKVAVIVPPVAAFVAAGFEHSIANLYFLPMGLMIKAWAPEHFWAAIGKLPSDYPVTLAANLANIAIATAGNLLGGSVLVGLVYWFVYLRPARTPGPAQGKQPEKR